MCAAWNTGPVPVAAVYRSCGERLGIWLWYIRLRVLSC